MYFIASLPVIFESTLNLFNDFTAYEYTEGKRHHY